jgi:hypothetical protein
MTNSVLIDKKCVNSDTLHPAGGSSFVSAIQDQVGMVTG